MALRNTAGDVVENVLLLNPGRWAAKGREEIERWWKRIREGRTLALGWVVPDDELLKFLSAVRDAITGAGR